MKRSAALPILLSAMGLIGLAVRGPWAALGDAAQISDPQYVNQWQLNNTGQDFPAGCIPGSTCLQGTPDADIDWAEAFDLGFTGQGVIIAIAAPSATPTVKCVHPELVDRLWEDPGSPGVNGWNFASDDSDVCLNESGSNHDTDVARNALASLNGSAGVGAAPDAELMLLMGIFGPTQGDDTVFYEEALPWAESKGARVIFVPYTGVSVADCADYGDDRIGGTPRNPVTRSGVLADSDVLVIWGCPGEFPGCDPSAVQLGGTDENDDDFSDSCTGPSPFIDFASPGMRTPVSSGTGLSWAIGTTAGAAALVLEEDPGATRSELFARLQQTADKVGPSPYDPNTGRNDEYGHGRLNVYNALMVGDVDGDGVPGDGDGTWIVGDGPCATGESGCDDNCPLEPNSGQNDSAGVGSGAPPDGIGDDCQCADVTADGAVLLGDADRVQEFLADTGPPLSAPEKCNVIGPPGGNPGECQIDDWARIRRAALGLDPPSALQQICGPAVP
jgi:hypothetical protein